MALVKQLAAEHKFFHWPLHFADLFTDKGGFDLMLGNPPWLRLEWNSGAVLGDYNPQLAIHRISATKAAKLRDSLFEQIPNAKAAWITEYEEISGLQQFLGDTCNFPLLKPALFMSPKKYDPAPSSRCSSAHSPAQA